MRIRIWKTPYEWRWVAETKRVPPSEIIIRTQTFTSSIFDAAETKFWDVYPIIWYRSNVKWKVEPIHFTFIVNRREFSSLRCRLIINYRFETKTYILERLVLWKALYGSSGSLIKVCGKREWFEQQCAVLYSSK